MSFAIDRKLGGFPVRRGPGPSKQSRLPMVRKWLWIAALFVVSQKKNAVEPSPHCVGCSSQLEQELPAKLEDPRIVGRSHLAEVGVGETSFDVVPLRMVEGVVGLSAELDP